MKRKVLLLVSVLLFLGIFGCQDKVELKEEPQKVEVLPFFEKLISAPFVNVPKEDLPDWLISRIELFEYGGDLGIPSPARFYRGTWNGRVTYFISAFFNCPFCNAYYENGENIVWTNSDEADNFQATSKDWVLIYKVIDDYPFF